MYDFRADRHDYGSLRPVAPIHEQQRYSVLAAVSNASASDLRQASRDYASWTQAYQQLPNDLPDRVRREARREINDTSNAYDAAIVQSVVDLAHAVGLSVVAEGLETPAQLDCLRRLGCDQGQGYLFSKPRPAQDLDALLATVHPLPATEAVIRSAARSPEQRLAWVVEADR